MTDEQQEKAISEAFEEVENMSDEQIESFTRFSSPPEDWEDFMIAMTPKQAEAFERWLLSHEQKIREETCDLMIAGVGVTIDGVDYVKLENLYKRKKIILEE